MVVHETNGSGLLENVHRQSLIEHPDALNRLIEHCFEYRSRAILLYTPTLPAAFLDLRTGLAGAILQKLRTYRIRLAIVQDTALTPSERFRELMHDESGYLYVRMYADRMDACRWLTKMRDRQRM